jgi:deoxyribodipyrimidine photo-lyase
LNSKTQLIWFRQDLRLSDQGAVAAAAKAGPVIALYIHDEELGGNWAIGAASKYWLHHSLNALGAELACHGVKLVLRRGPVEETLMQVLNDIGPATIHVTRHFEPWYVELDEKLSKTLDYQIHHSGLLYEPEDVFKDDGTPFRVFTPFYKALLAKGPVPNPMEDVPSLIAAKTDARSDDLENWGLLPQNPNWAESFDWNPGKAHAVLSDFQDKLLSYKAKRDRPDLDMTSKLSPHLHFGEISARQVWHGLLKTHEFESAAPFLRQLVWRDFSYTLLTAQQDFADKAWNSKFKAFPWANAHPQLDAWKYGRTGYPIVDAAMRQLWQTGWMHNRLRMIVASFLTKDMGVHWRVGEKWFWDTLVDADLANNAAGWQWTAGSGADASPYFRVFNPITQGEKFDPNGDFVRQYVPELSKLPKSHIHKPWTADEEILKAANITLGKDYPHPILDHGEARREALAAYETTKQRQDEHAPA